MATHKYHHSNVYVNFHAGHSTISLNTRREGASLGSGPVSRRYPPKEIIRHFQQHATVQLSTSRSNGVNFQRFQLMACSRTTMSTLPVRSYRAFRHEDVLNR